MKELKSLNKIQIFSKKNFFAELIRIKLAKIIAGKDRWPLSNNA